MTVTSYFAGVRVKFIDAKDLLEDARELLGLYEIAR